MFFCISINDVEAQPMNLIRMRESNNVPALGEGKSKIILLALNKLVVGISKFVITALSKSVVVQLLDRKYI